MAKDKFHDHVKAALIKDGWIVTNDPLKVKASSLFTFNIDLAAEKQFLIAENKHKEMIAVEVKTLDAKSFIYDYHNVVGQYGHYMLALKRKKIKRKLYLAIPDYIYVKYFGDPFIMDDIIKNNMSIMTYDTKLERIVQWLPR